MYARAGVDIVSHPPASFRPHDEVTDHFQVSYDPALGDDGTAAVKAILAVCEQDFSALQDFFGGITPEGMPFQIVLTTGTTGASHATCTSTRLDIGVRSTPTLDTGVVRQLVIAEADEVFMASFGRGWNCGYSNGEGLSRVLANELVPGAEPKGFVSSTWWLNSARENFVERTDRTDRNYYSIGCSVLFLNWTRYKQGYSWKDIIAAGDATLGEMYARLTGLDNAWQAFSSEIESLFPSGTPVDLDSDNPWAPGLALPTANRLYSPGRRPPGAVIEAAAAHAASGRCFLVVDTERSDAELLTVAAPDCGQWFAIPSSAVAAVEVIGPGCGSDPSRPLCEVVFKSQFRYFSGIVCGRGSASEAVGLQSGWPQLLRQNPASREYAQTTAVLPRADIAASDPPLGQRTSAPTVEQTLPGINVPMFWTQQSHQVFVRVTGGNLGAPNYFQRVVVYRYLGAPPGPATPGSFIDQLGGSWPSPTPWHAYDPVGGVASYYFGGQYHQDDAWRWDAGVHLLQEQYTNGIMFTYDFDDGHRGWYNDYHIQAALIWVWTLNPAVVGSPVGAPDMEGALMEPAADYMGPG